MCFQKCALMQGIDWPSHGPLLAFRSSEALAGKRLRIWWRSATSDGCVALEDLLKGELTLRALKMPGSQVMNFRLLMLTRPGK